MKSESRIFNLLIVEKFTKKYHFNFKCDFYLESLMINFIL